MDDAPHNSVTSVEPVPQTAGSTVVPTSQMPSAPETPSAAQATPAIDPVYASVVDAPPQETFDRSQPSTVAQQISTLSQAERPTPIVPLAHTVEEVPLVTPELPPAAPLPPITPPTSLPTQVPEPIADVPVVTSVPVEPPAETPSTASEVSAEQKVTTSAKSLVILVVVFVFLFGLTLALGYWLGSRQG
jgi:hypothetical protein